MVIDDVFDDRHSETGPAHIARAPLVDAVETLGQPRQVLGRDRAAVTQDRRAPHHRRQRAAAAGGHRYRLGRRLQHQPHC